MVIAIITRNHIAIKYCSCISNTKNISGTLEATAGGTGQGTTTCEFNEGTTSSCTNGQNYAYSSGGYGCGTGGNGTNGSGKSGSNSGSGGQCQSTGYSGIIAIRNKR